MSEPTTLHLPQSAIEEDHRLEASTEKASERLAKHRWHWTLDESNPDRVPIRMYARQVGVGETVIRRHVNGYAAWTAGGRVRSLNEEVERAKVSAEKEAAIEAVAKARGLSFTRVRQDRGDEVRHVRDIARDRAEARGTSVTDEVADVAQSVVATEESEAQQRVEHKERHGLRWVEVEGHLAAALDRLRKAQAAMTDVPFDDEERDLLRHSVAQVVALAGLIDKRLTGTALDWDAELAKIMEGVK